MGKRLLLLTVILSCAVSSAGEAANIIWVSDGFDESGDGTPDDQLWVDMLRAEGHTVTSPKAASRGVGYWQTLDNEKIAALDAADLIVVGRCTASPRYNDEGEPTQWNSLKTPLILLNDTSPEETGGFGLIR